VINFGQQKRAQGRRRGDVPLGRRSHAFHTEYGRYPADAREGGNKQKLISRWAPGIGLKDPNSELFYSLRAMDAGVKRGTGR
jgi:hypothetical protein